MLLVDIEPPLTAEELTLFGVSGSRTRRENGYKNVVEGGQEMTIELLKLAVIPWNTSIFVLVFDKGSLDKTLSDKALVHNEAR